VSSSLVAIHLPVVTELGTVMLFGAGIGLATLPFLLRRRTSSAGSTYAEPASAHSVE